MSKWQLIETWNRDEQVKLQNTSFPQAIGIISGSVTVFSDWGEDANYGQWHDELAWETNGKPTCKKPTHWQLLPEPPK